MAEQQPEGKADAGRSGMSSLIILGIVVLVAAVAALAVFLFVLKPMLAAPAESEEVTSPEPTNGTFFVTFEDLSVTGQANAPDEIPPLLIFSVTFACPNEETVAFIEARRPHFANMITNLYCSKTERQLSQEKEFILDEALRKARALLKEFGAPDTVAITNVLHDGKYTLVTP